MSEVCGFFIHSSSAASIIVAYFSCTRDYLEFDRSVFGKYFCVTVPDFCFHFCSFASKICCHNVDQPSEISLEKQGKVLEEVLEFCGTERVVLWNRITAQQTRLFPLTDGMCDFHNYFGTVSYCGAEASTIWSLVRACIWQFVFVFRVINGGVMQNGIYIYHVIDIYSTTIK